ncbi:hypothetical protein M2272_000687 [Mycobacterium frederiksbergense]|uniref:Uncharacterized protein n=1 Tax=Mycolicibacterium frederiksbergense TaxID=117567 RepID=A0ABT6KTL8_9MYCO|nr:hypothetical protein [Mycolicibacterium frederiksbergense]
MLRPKANGHNSRHIDSAIGAGGSSGGAGGLNLIDLMKTATFLANPPYSFLPYSDVC